MRLAIKGDFLVRVILTAVFVLSFLPYVFGLTLAHLLIPIAVLSALAVLLPLINPLRFGLAISSLRSGPFLWLAVIMPILPFTWAVLHQDMQSLLYTLLMLAVLMSCRLILTVIGFRAVVRAFSVAGLICVPIFLVSSWGRLMYAAHNAIRFRPAETQPNTIAYMFAGFTVVWLSDLWDTRSWTRALCYEIAVLIASYTIFLASSRASMLAVAVAVLSVAGISMLRLRPASVVSVDGLAKFVLACCLALLVVLVVGPMTLEWYIGRFLQIHSQYRGFDSGLSGRFPRWSKASSQVFNELHWVFGYGYHTSQARLGFSIDNGYLTILYEAGVLGLSIILVRLINLLRWSFKSIYRFPQLRAPLMILVAFMLNNTFDRYLFQMGNPFSLLGLFVLLLDRRDLRAYKLVWLKAKDMPSDADQATHPVKVVSRADSVSSSLDGPMQLR